MSGNDEEIDKGIQLSSRVINWAWRWERVHQLRSEGASLREISGQVGCSYETVRVLLSQSNPPIL